MTPAYTTPVQYAPAYSDALIRKRERDKQNQRKKRTRERVYIAQLEAKVACLEQELANLPPTVSGFSSRAHNVASFSPRSTAATPTQPEQQDHVLVQTAILGSLLTSPEWLRHPLWNVVRPNASYRFLNRGEGFIPLQKLLRDDPDLAHECTPNPKTLDLLYGGSRNILANFVNDELANLPYLAPEKFASAYIIYRYLRWLIWPTETNFQEYPVSYRPTVRQLCQEHHLAFDFLPWPSMRDNFIHHRADCDLEHVLGLFCCTFRIKGWFGKHFITRENDGDPIVMPEFVEDFMNSSNWCLLEKFWVEYPSLVAGMHSTFMLHEKSLEPGVE